MPDCLGAVGSGTPAVLCLTAWGQWVMEVLLYTTSLPGGGHPFAVGMPSKHSPTAFQTSTLHEHMHPLAQQGIQ